MHATKVYELPQHLEPLSVRAICGELGHLEKTNHKNIVEFYECFVHGDKLWIILEYVQGACLDVLHYYVHFTDSNGNHHQRCS